MTCWSWATSVMFLPCDTSRKQSLYNPWRQSYNSLERQKQNSLTFHTKNIKTKKIAFINIKRNLHNCWFSHDVTKIQTTKLSILLWFYFHGVLEQLKTNFETDFGFKRVVGFVIEYAWISKLLRDVAFTWRPRELSFRLKKWPFSRNFAI